MPECMCICKSRCRCRFIIYVYKLNICVFLHLRCCCVFPCSHPPMTHWPKPNRWPHGYLWRLWSLHDSISLMQDLGQKLLEVEVEDTTRLSKKNIYLYIYIYLCTLCVRLLVWNYLHQPDIGYWQVLQNTINKMINDDSGADSYLDELLP